MKYIASWSGGKDSTASIILAHENNEPLDLIIFSEVMFDKNISGELPEHIDFIKNKCILLFESWEYEVKILRSDKTYMDCFHHRTIRGKNLGIKKGFVMSGHCDVQRDCKLRPIAGFWKSLDGEYMQYMAYLQKCHNETGTTGNTSTPYYYFQHGWANSSVPVSVLVLPQREMPGNTGVVAYC